MERRGEREGDAKAKRRARFWAIRGVLLLGLALTVAPAFPDDGEKAERVPERNGSCGDLPSHATLKAALTAALGATGGLENDMWGTLVDRDGVVCAVAFTGANRGAQWPGSRVISAQKANTANAFSLPPGAGGIPGLALSTANLYTAVQPGGTLYVGAPPGAPGGSLYGLQHSNPVDTDVAYRGNPAHYGQPNDPMVGRRIGGVNVFGGGLALYNAAGALVGGLGVSGDTSCADHIVAWRTRHALNLDNVVAGVAPAGTDNIIHDLVLNADGHTRSANGFGHPECSADSTATAAALPTTHPIGPAPAP
jgi:uncharacterized protein GlcG (DUF336 family)